MSGERDETLEDIATKIREGGFGELADHIEAALNAERERSREYWTKKCRDTIAEHDRYCGNSAALRETLEHCRNCAQMIPQFVQGSRPERSSLDAVARYANAIVGEVKAALSVPPRACDIMSEADLSKVVTSGIVASIEPRPDLNTVGAKTLIEIAVASAIKCAYDTQLVSTKEGEAK